MTANGCAMRWRGVAALAMAAAACTTDVLHAASGGLRVRVLDPAGQPVQGAVVSCTNSLGLSAPASVLTGADGIAAFPILRPGAGYGLELQFPGYRPWSLQDVRVPSGVSQTIDVRLDPLIQEGLEVHATGPVVDLDQTESVTRFDAAFIAGLPLEARVYQRLLTLAPGVSDADADGNPNVHGARSRDVRIELGGVANVDPLTGQWLSYVNPDSIEELEVITTGAGAAFGRAQGGWGRILQKQGTNAFEGLVQVLVRSSDLDGNGATDLEGARVPSYEAVQPAVHLSGPIVRDRLWFRISGERIRRDDPVVTRYGVQVTSLEQQTLSGQITWQASPRNKFYLHYDADPRTVANAEIRGSVPVESSQTWEFGGPTLRLAWTAAQSPRLIVHSELGLQNHEVAIRPTVSGLNNSCVINLIYPSLDVAQCFYATKNQTSGSYYRTSEDERARLTVRSDAEWFAGRGAGMDHHLRFGVLVESERYDRHLEMRPDVVFKTYRGLYFPFGYATYRLPIPAVSDASVEGDNWGIYVEDQAQIGSQLAVTAGVRIDSETVVVPTWSDFDPAAELGVFRARVAAGEQPEEAIRESFTGDFGASAFRDGLAVSLGVPPEGVPMSPIAVQSAFWSRRRVPQTLTIDNVNVSPRLAVAWDPEGRGKMKLAVSAGRYHDKIFLGVPLVEQEPPSAYFTFLAWPVGGYVRTWYADLLTSPPSTINHRSVDSSLRTPYQDELALSFEREIAPELSVKATLMRRWFEDQLQDTDVNHVVGDWGRCQGSWWNRAVDPSEGPDGQLDDCRYGGDGVPDLYHQNPAWGDILQVGNLNTTDYRAVILEINRRWFRGWQLNASYTWSEATGAAEDFDQTLGDDRTRIDEERGPLEYDQTHVVKVAAAASLPAGVQLGGTLRWESGLPYSTYVSGTQSYLVPPGSIGTNEDRVQLDYVDGQRNQQTNPSFLTIDVRLAKAWTLAGSASLELSVEAFNLLNDDTIRYFNVTDETPDDVRRFGRRWQLGARVAW